jgi:transposase
MKIWVSERVYDLCVIGDNKPMPRKKYASDIGAEQFTRIEPLLRSVRRNTKPVELDLYEVFCAVLYLLRTGCPWRFLPSQFPKWQSVYAYWRKWREPDEQGISALERALKKSGWRAPRATGAQQRQHVVDGGRAQREKHRHGNPQRL